MFFKKELKKPVHYRCESCQNVYKAQMNPPAFIRYTQDGKEQCICKTCFDKFYKKRPNLDSVKSIFDDN